MNFKQMIDRCTVERKGIKKAALDGQKKQATESNKGKEWIRGEKNPSNTICTRILGRDMSFILYPQIAIL